MMMHRHILTISLLICSSAVWAENSAPASPIGVWATHSGKTGEVQAHIAIAERNGRLVGRIVQVLDKNAKPGERCEKCQDDRKNKPMASLEIIRGVEPLPHGNDWVGGRILDPQEGREYRLKLIPKADGKTLGVRGYLGPFFRTQEWTRVHD